MNYKGNLNLKDFASQGGKVIASRPGHMAKIGRTGGLKISKDREHMAALGRASGVAKRKKKLLEEENELLSKNLK